MGRPYNENRLSAIAAGLKTYATGRPCSRGHLAPRYVATSQCVECSRLKGIEQRDAARTARPPKPTSTTPKFKLRPRSAEARVHHAAAGRRFFDFKEPNLPPCAMHALADYHKSKQSVRNSEYLDSLIRKIA